MPDAPKQGNLRELALSCVQGGFTAMAKGQDRKKETKKPKKDKK